MIDKDILDGLSELDEADLKRVKLLVDNKLNIESDVKVSYRTKSIKCVEKSHVIHVLTVHIGMQNGPKKEREKPNI